MSVLLWTIPLMVVVVAISTVPVLMAMIGEHRRHQGHRGHLGQPAGHTGWALAGQRAGLPSSSRSGRGSSLPGRRPEQP